MFTMDLAPIYVAIVVSTVNCRSYIDALVACTRDIMVDSDLDFGVAGLLKK